jgi:hypothetical protein
MSNLKESSETNKQTNKQTNNKSKQKIRRIHETVSKREILVLLLLLLFTHQI